jgi:RNA recognition motif-containing protein
LRIYAGNLDRDVTEGVLRELFSTQGQVESVSIMRDRDTQRSKGFAFIDMPSRTEGLAAIQALNESEFHQRVLTVNEARPREERSPTSAGSFRPSAADDRRRSTPRGGRDRR